MRPMLSIFSSAVPGHTRPLASPSLNYLWLLQFLRSQAPEPSLSAGILCAVTILPVCAHLPPLTQHPLQQVSQPLVPLVDEFAARLFGELDYVQEGHNCEKFAKLYKDVPRVRERVGGCMGLLLGAGGARL